MKRHWMAMVIALSFFGLDAKGERKLPKAGNSTAVLLKTGKLSPIPAGFGNVFIGETGDIIGVNPTIPGPGAAGTTHHLSSGSFSGSTDFVIVEDGCSNAVLGAEESCELIVQFEPTTVGEHNASITFGVVYCDQDNPPDCTFIYQVEFSFHGTSFIKPPQEPCIRCGSTIQVDNRTVIERIPIVGSEFSLNYTSEHSASFDSPYNDLGTNTYFNPEGWTISEHHFYNQSQRRLFRGDGTTEYREYETFDAPPNVKMTVVSSDGREVYVFDFTTGRHLATKRALTGSVKYTFSYSNQKLVAIEDSFGNETELIRDGNGKLTEIHAPYGQVTEVTVTNGLISSVENPNNETYQMTYHTGTDLLATFTKPGSQVSTLTYDQDGKLTKDEGHGGNFWELFEDANVITLRSEMDRETNITKTNHALYYERSEELPDGNVKVFKQFHNGEETISYDNQHKITKAFSSSDTQFGQLYTPMSSQTLRMGGVDSTTTFSRVADYGSNTPGHFNFETLTTTRTTNGRTHTTVYDAATKTFTSTSDEGATTETEINSNEQVVEFKVGNDTPWTYTYDANGRLTESTQGTHNTSTISYNAAGLVSSIENVRSETTGFTYNSAGRMTKMTLPDSREINYSYDANGNLTGVTPPSKPQHAFTFNAFELLDTYSPPSIGVSVPKNTEYDYNDDKQMTKITRPDGEEIDFTYDLTTAQLTTITTSDGTYNMVYSPTTQHMTKKKSPYGIRNQFTYYGLLRASDEQQRASDDFLFGKVSFAFDSDHRRSSRTIQGNSSSNTSTINYTYNDDDMPVQVGDLELAYSYPSGRLHTTEIDKISDERTYNSYGELTGYTAKYNPSGGSPVTLYSYTLTRDDGGRITAKSETIDGTTNNYEYTYDSTGRLTEVEKDSTVVFEFTYDSNSNRTGGTIGGTSFTATYDDQDRLETFDTQEYTYNNNGDLTQIDWNTTQTSQFVYDPMGNLKQVTLPNSTVLDYVYDGLDRRIVKKIGSTVQWRYIYEDQYKIAAIINNSNAIAKEFVYATRVNVPDYMITGGNKYRIITDHLGSPILVVRVDNGTITQKMTYNVLGKVLSDTNQGFQPFGFAGGIYDPATQLVKFGARDYDPRSLGRWNTKDPIRFKGGDTNLYGYTLSDPINFIDYTGMDAWSDIGDFFDRTKERQDTMTDSLKGTSIGEKLQAIGAFCSETAADAGETISKLLGGSGDSATNKQR